LDETYSRILKAIPSNKESATKLILQLLAYCKRPLTIEEVADAAVVRLEETPAFQEHYRLPILEEVTRYCSGLVVVVDGPAQTDGASRTLQLAHYSVKEWLLSGPFMDLRLGERAVHRTIASICIAYWMSIPREIRAEDLDRQRPFKRYAALWWSQHVLESGASSSEWLYI
jgi:hypothetical protein